MRKGPKTVLDCVQASASRWTSRSLFFLVLAKTFRVDSEEGCVGFNICQTYLNEPYIHKVLNPISNLKRTLNHFIVHKTKYFSFIHYNKCYRISSETIIFLYVVCMSP